MLLLTVKHVIADFMLQNSWMAIGKDQKTGWALPLLAHCLVHLAVLMARLAFPYLFFMSLATVFAAILNSLSKFAAAAAAPILLNVAMVGALLSAWLFATPAHAAAWGVLLAGAVVSPHHSDVFLLSAFGFTANMAVTYQDVGIDSLAIDIMAESERAKAGGIMFGAQVLGISVATALARWKIKLLVSSCAK